MNSRSIGQSSCDYYDSPQHSRMDSKTTTKRRDSKTSKDMKTERKNSKDLKNMEKEEKKAEKIVKEDKEDEKKAKKQRKAMKKQFQEEIKAINESIMKEGENTFYTVLPQKIKKLDEFLKTNSMFQKSVDEIGASITVDQSIIAIQAEEAAVKLKKYVKECVNTYDRWRKANLFEKRPASSEEDDSRKKRLRVGSEGESKYALPLPPAALEEDEDEKHKDNEIPKFPKEAMFEINQDVNNVIEYVKTELRDGFRMLASIKMWIQLQVPKIEDGNNFGVEIQSEVIDAISGVEDMCLNILDNMSHYFETRATFIQKIVKYPNIRDFYQSLKEVDQTEYINMKLSCSDLRNNYCALFDLILKNIDKLLTPRTNNDISTTMY